MLEELSVIKPSEQKDKGIVDVLGRDIILVKGDMDVEEGLQFKTFCEKYAEDYKSFKDKNENGVVVRLEIPGLSSDIVNTLFHFDRICKPHGLKLAVTYPVNNESLYKGLRFCNLTDTICVEPHY